MWASGTRLSWSAIIARLVVLIRVWFSPPLTGCLPTSPHPARQLLPCRLARVQQPCDNAGPAQTRTGRPHDRRSAAANRSGASSLLERRKRPEGRTSALPLPPPSALCLGPASRAAARQTASALCSNAILAL